MYASSTLQWETQDGGRASLSSDPQGAGRAECQPFSRRWHRAQGYSCCWRVVTKETSFSAASCRGAVPVMDRQRRGRNIWKRTDNKVDQSSFFNRKYNQFTHRWSQHPPLRALPRPDLNSLMRGWMMGERATRGRWVWPMLVEPEPGPEPVSRLEEKFT